MKDRKECSVCHALKVIDLRPEVSEFSPNGLTTSGRQKWRGACKACDSKRLKKTRRGDPFLYIVLKCGRCDKTSPVRIYTSNEDGTHAFLCETCTKKLQDKIKEKK